MVIINKNMKIYIKNMVCDRCKMVVKSEMQEIGFLINSISLGIVEVPDEIITEKIIMQLDKRLQELGFYRINDKTSKIIEKIKIVIIQYIHHTKPNMKKNWSYLIANELNLEYNYLSNLFSSTEEITIEQFIIRQKIEKAKELLLYNELTVNEIAFDLGYSSAAYLSSQFKKVTGFTPTDYKRNSKNERKELDNL